MKLSSGEPISGKPTLGAKELTVEQLCKASILYDAKLDQELEAQIKHECSDLLKEPQTTKDNTSGEKK